MPQNKKWKLGTLKGTTNPVFLEGFKWSCDWYWSGGYVGNSQFHTHFNGCFLDCPDSRGHCLNSGHATFLDPWTNPPEYVKPESVKRISNGAAIWESLDFFLDDAQYTEKEWWRIKDLFIQFYKLKDAAEVFAHGGHCTSQGRTDEEINPEMAASINKHIETVIIPEIEKALNKETT